ncbi:MAG TPA: hypothetical protein VD973_06975 [Symbiobacteriaceae bacterium]|nr:hypothetical protein [Symbiobacteriaceae bacterium]
MRIWLALVVALLVSACSAPISAQSIQLPPGPRQLEMLSRPNGWLLKATTESNTGQDQENRPWRTWWLGTDRAFVQWWWGSDTELYQVNLADGAVARWEEADEILSVSPDGRHLVIRTPVNREVWLTDVSTGDLLYKLPDAISYVNWLSPTLLHVVYRSASTLVYDTTTGKETPLPGGGAPTVLLADREICSRVRVDEVSCVPVAGGEPNLLTPYPLHPSATYRDARMAWSADRRYLAVTYPADTSVGARPTGTILAVASAKPVTYRWANEVAVYEGATGRLVRLPLGGEYLINEMIWSADGSYLALALGRMTRRGATVKPSNITELRVLNRATGQMEQVDALPSDVRLRMVTDQGEVIYQKNDKAEPLIAGPGAEPRAWAPGLRMLPGPMWDEPPEPLAFVGQKALEVRTQEGAVHRWQWEGTETNASFSLGPEARWVALKFYKPGEAVFLKR